MSFVHVTSQLSHQIKEDEMDGACGMHGGDEKFIQSFCQKTQREETTWKNLGMNRKILEWLLGK
jgi:hypothetical protein